MTEPTTPPAITLADFKALGTALANGSGFSYDGYVQPIYAAFAPVAGVRTLADVVRDTPPAERDGAIAAHGLTALAHALTAAWYGAMVFTDLPVSVASYDAAAAWVARTRPAVTAYNDAPVWTAVAYTPSPATSIGWASWTGKPA